MEQIWFAEIQILEQLQQVAIWIIQFFKGVTFLGEENFFMVLMPIFYWCIDMSIGYRFTLVLLLSNWINAFFKMLIHFPRPYWLSTSIKAHVIETSFGLPSGHSTNAASIWLFLAKQYRSKKLWVAFCITMTLLIMLSRLFLGMHFISDVLAGLLLGILLLVVFFWAEKKFSSKIDALPIQNKIYLSIVSTVLFVLIANFPILINTFTLPPEWIERSIQATNGTAPAPFAIKGMMTLAGVWFSMNIGYALLKETNHPLTTKGTPVQYLLRIVIGLAGAMALRYGIKMLYPAADGILLHFFDFLRYAIMTFWIAYLAPLLFVKLNLYKKSYHLNKTG
ncbi:MAG: phosphatase PAP2 family protein [Anaerolineaceae bacterium]|nr:phosphatase PAP2 family protein [Anaerolineaceae bacterium]